MDDTNLERATSMANREDPIPVIRLPSQNDEHITSSDTELDRNRKEKLKDQAKTAKDAYATSGLKQGIQDRFFENLMAKVVPANEEDEGVDEAKKDQAKDRRSRKYVERPNFSLGVMNANFRRFNARIGIVFVMQNRIIYLLTWRRPVATFSFLSVWSLLCLEPHLLPLVPFVGLLFSIMTPSFLARHPIPANDPRIEPRFGGPAIAPASRVKPAPEFSKDFFRNMRDLQNSMEDFSRLHDAANDLITPYTNFSDEKVSSELYAAFFVVSFIGLVGSQLVPWRFIFLIAGWAGTLLCHPNTQALLLSSRTISQVLAQIKSAQTALRSYAESDILLDEPPQRRQVEIFELQKYHPDSDSWEGWLFSASPFDPLSPARIAGARAKGTQFFEDVQAPNGWIWKDKKWIFDLASREWVEQRMITGVEIETEGERWVYDLPQEAVEMLEGPSKGKKKTKIVPKSGWEEGNGLGERGEWRRRRWIRLVERKVVGKGSTKPD